MTVVTQTVQYAVGMSTGPSLRERKKQRTRRALLEAAINLFHAKGYESTTVAEIAAAAEVAPRTFFAYFPTKEDVLFADTEDRIRNAVTVVENRSPDDRPADLLLRVVEQMVDSGMVKSELFRRLAPLRLRLLLSSPSVQGAALRRLLDAQVRLAGLLRGAYPDELDDSTAAAVVGAFAGALLGVGTVLLRDVAAAEKLAGERPDEMLREMYKALEVVFRGVYTLGSDHPDRRLGTDQGT